MCISFTEKTRVYVESYENDTKVPHADCSIVYR